MSVALVIVSHSARLADGVVELAREMGGEGVVIEAAGGLAEPEGAIGTDAERVREAITRAGSPDGVLVLMDLGSAVMSAEMAAEMVAAEDGPRVALTEAPLVEGAVAAAALARAGAPLEEVAAEARGALRMKVEQLGAQEEAPAAPPEPAEDGVEERLEVLGALGLHARPAARVAEAAARFDARVTLTDETNGRGPADARSLTALVTLGARHGHVLLARASGPQAGEALAALRELAAAAFGDEPAGGAPRRDGRAPGGPPPAPDADEGAGRDAGADAAPPAAGSLLRGVPGSPGIVIAAARRAGARAPLPDVDEAAGEPEAEWARLEEAREAARRGVREARARVAAQAGEHEAGIFDAHLLLLDDEALVEPARRAVREEGRPAGAAWRAAAEAAAATYRALEDPYLRERADDVDDVAARVLRALAGEPAAPEGPAPEQPGVLVVADLTPGDAAALDRERVLGLAVARGGATSHAAILARALGIPAVLGLGDAVLGVADGTPLVLDGDAGTVEVEPSEATVAERERAREAAERLARRAAGRRREPARTPDGTTVEVAANVGGAREVREAVELGADGVGLLRTEFLFLDRDDPPGEDEQREVLTEVARALEGRPLVVRTLDAGADKPLPFLPQPPEDNPFLGVRGIRLALARPDLLRTQLRAIVAVAAEHPVRVMFPMVATLGELRAARAVLDEAREALGAPPLQVGVMVEVPAVALAAERFAAEVDFLSIGTNDLAQYTMAAERGNPRLAGLLAGAPPALLRLVAATARAGAARGCWVGVCGELAGRPDAALLLAGLGVGELSMAARSIAVVKETLRAVPLAQAEEAARRALDAEDADEVESIVAPLVASAHAA